MEKLTREQFFEHLKGLTLLEVSDYIKEFEKTFNISAAPVMVAGAAPAVEAAKAEEKTEFNVILKAVGDKKINVIKVVREVTSLGLKEAKDLVDGAPKPLKEGVTKEEAESIKAKFAEVGAVIELQ
ncbi:MAG: 50S ribosomal protein L7/L12 [Candidatus Aminicenantes bacterium]|nr:50S ribosomal protein L7/L12 [Candidatus Aminicenantes bacterium]